MSPADHTLAALQGLQRARNALDVLWLDARQGVPCTAALNALVHNVVHELVGVHDSLESVVECTLSGIVRDLDPQRMTVSDWQEDDDHA